MDIGSGIAIGMSAFALAGTITNITKTITDRRGKNNNGTSYSGIKKPCLKRFEDGARRFSKIQTTLKHHGGELSYIRGRVDKIANSN